MNITVYLGANEGNTPTLKAAVQELGRWIGESGNALIYGGSRSGLMGALADSVLAAGGKVIGVEPAGANCMQESLKKGEVTTLSGVNTIADGTACNIHERLRKEIQFLNR